jgi:hypothetical protein
MVCDLPYVFGDCSNALENLTPERINLLIAELQPEKLVFIAIDSLRRIGGLCKARSSRIVITEFKLCAHFRRAASIFSFSSCRRYWLIVFSSGITSIAACFERHTENFFIVSIADFPDLIRL